MNPFAGALLLVTALGMLALPRRWISLPLLMGACYTTNAQTIDLGPFHFSVLRILLLIGFIRCLSRNETLPGGIKGMDKLILLWGVWLLFSSFFHQPFGEALVFRLGFFYNVLGIYFLLRITCQNEEALIQLIKITAIVLLPVALEMLLEQLTGRNVFGYLGGVPIDVPIREGKLRAQGPFGHPILTGTVGGVCLPLMVGVWPKSPFVAKVGLSTCLVMVVASSSSGPLMTLLLGAFAVALWRWRQFTHVTRIAAVIMYLSCELFMTRPAYFLLEKIDLSGGSTGYYRAALIDAGVNHLNEWWFAGTDYTRHWMWFSVSWSENHADITNHYLYNGVEGGLPAVLLLIGALWAGFRYVSQILRTLRDASFSETFLVWSLGASLFAHIGSMIAVAYFEQSILFLYMILAVITSIHASTNMKKSESPFIVP